MQVAITTTIPPSLEGGHRDLILYLDRRGQ